MKTVFTADDISRANAIVKRAGTMVHNPVAVNGITDYDGWLGPKSLLEPTPPKRPGFWSSLGRTALGTMADYGGDRVRSFFGASPGPSTMAGLLSYGPLYAYGKATGNAADVARAQTGLRASFDVPYAAARKQSRPAQFALADYMSKEHPGFTSAVTQPVKTFMDWVESPGPFDKPARPLPPSLLQPRKTIIPPVQ